MAANIGRPKVLSDGQAALWDWLERRGFDQREAAAFLDIHWVTLNGILSGRKRPGLAIAIRIEQGAGIDAGIWMRTRVRDSKRRSQKPPATLDKSSEYRHAR